MNVDHEALQREFAKSYTGYWRCVECGIRIVRTANVVAHDCNGDHVLHVSMIDVPTYACRACGWSVEEPILPFEHKCPGAKEVTDAAV